MGLVDGYHQVRVFVVPGEVCRAAGLRLGGGRVHGGGLRLRGSCGWRWCVSCGFRRGRRRRAGLNSLGNGHGDSVGFGLIDGMGLGYGGGVGHSGRLCDGYGSSVGHIGSLCLRNSHASRLVVSHIDGMGLCDVAGAVRRATAIGSQGDIDTAGNIVHIRLRVDVMTVTGIARDELGAAMVLEHAIRIDREPSHRSSSLVALELGSRF